MNIKFLMKINIKDSFKLLNHIMASILFRRKQTNQKIKHIIYMFNNDDKIIKENKGRTMISRIKEQKKFNEQQLKFD